MDIRLVNSPPLQCAFEERERERERESERGKKRGRQGERESSSLDFLTVASIGLLQKFLCRDYLFALVT